MKIKKASWLYIALAIVMVASMFAGFTGAVEPCPDPPDEAKEVILYAGQDDKVGKVYVWDDDFYLYVQYLLDDDAWDDGEGWGLYETHVHVGEDLDSFPLNRGGNPQIGHFAYKAYHEGVQCYIEEIPLGDFSGEIKIAAHAVIERFAGYGDAISATIYGIVPGYTGGGPQGNIYEIDPLLELETLIFDNPSTDFEANWYPNALAYDEENNRLYFATTRNTLMFYDFSSSDSLNALTNADPNNYFANNNDVLGAAFGDGSFWYILNQSNFLYRVDFDDNGLATGRTSYALPTGGVKLSQGDIVYDKGMIYGSSGTPAGGGDNLKGFFSYNIGENEFLVLFEDEDYKALQIDWGLDNEGNKAMYGCRGTDENKKSEWYTVDWETGIDTPIDFTSDYAYWDLTSKVIYEEIWEGETAWADGTRFVEKGNWATYFCYTVQE